MNPQALSSPSAQTSLEENWLHADTEARGRQHHFGLWDPQLVIAMSGLEVFQAVAVGRLPAPPLHQTLDIRLAHVDFGHVVYQARPRPGHLNPLGTAHGGWIATLLDAAAGCAVHTTLPAGRTCTTSTLNIHYLRPLTPDVPIVRAVGRVVHQGKSSGTSEARVEGPDGRLFAHATSTVVILQAR